MNKKAKFCYDYPRPALTVDCVLFSEINNEKSILLIQRKNEPFKDAWAFPGGFVDMDETTYDAAKRELKEETGIEINNLVQVHTFSDVDRDPRGRTVSVVYFSEVKSEDFEINAGDDASDAKWFSLKNLPKLAFDHDMILEFVLKRFN
ncbi:MAG: NUDIX hydrolase [Chlorobi bacterium]|nr:NUDIX hydrolase [Chlorobiota bacterium]